MHNGVRKGRKRRKKEKGKEGSSSSVRKLLVTSEEAFSRFSLVFSMASDDDVPTSLPDAGFIALNATRLEVHNGKIKQHS